MADAAVANASPLILLSRAGCLDYRSPASCRRQVRATWEDAPIERDREVRELVGRCVWDLFADNHDVVAPDCRLVHLGSFRGAGGFVADLLNRIQRYRDAGVARLLFNLAPAKADEVLPVLDRCADLMRRAGAGTSSTSAEF